MTMSGLERSLSAIGRTVTARRLLSAEQLRESLALNPRGSTRPSLVAGLQAALTSAIALPLVSISPWPHLIGFASLGALAALFGRFAPEGQRSAIVLRCALWLVAAVFGMSLLGWLGAPLELKIMLLALACGLFFFVAHAGRFGPPGPLIFVFAASAPMGREISAIQLWQFAGATALVAALAWVICHATEHLRLPQGAAVGPAPEPLEPISQRLLAAGRIILACAIAGYVAHAIGARYPAWAAMGTLAVMQATRLHLSMSRSLQRMMGTIVGALLIGIVLAQSPSVWPVIGLLLVLIVSTEVIIGINYGIGQILVTPMALLMTYLANPQSAGSSMIYERVWDTLLGAIIGMAMAVLCSTLADRAHLASHHAGRRA